MEKGAAFITALITLIAGTLSSTIGLGVVDGIMNDFGSQGDSGAQVEFQNFVDDVEEVCGSNGGNVVGVLNLKSGKQVEVDVSEGKASVSESDLEHDFSCDIVNKEDITYSAGASYIIDRQEEGVSIG